MKPSWVMNSPKKNNTKKLNTETPSPQRSDKFSSGFVPVYRDAKGVPHYLILRCFNYWDFPKGGVHEGETPLETAAREMAEETNLKESKMTWGDSFRETPPYSNGKVARYYVCEVRTQDVELLVNPEIGRPEHHEYRWLKYEKTRPLLGDRVFNILEWAHALVMTTRSDEEQS